MTVTDLGTDAIFRYRVDIDPWITRAHEQIIWAWVRESAVYSKAHIANTGSFWFDQESDVVMFTLRWS